MYKFNFPEIATDNTINQQVWKIIEETNEVQDEQIKIAKARILKGESCPCNDLIMETLDVIQACETLLHLLPVTKAQLDRMHDEVVRKNQRRSYYKEGKGNG